MSQPSVAVLGGGSFGTALAHLAASNGCPITLWVRKPELVQQINEQNHNEAYLPGVELAAGIRADTDLKHVVSDADVVLVAVPSDAFRMVCRRLVRFLPPETRVISTTKGVESQTSADEETPEDDGQVHFRLMSQVLVEELLRRGRNNPLGVIAGPNLAGEIVQGQYAGAVVASEDEQTRKMGRQALESDNFRLHESEDVFGVELGGAMKNIYAIILGLASASGAGKNAEGLLLTQSIREMCLFAEDIGGLSETFLGLSGVGDLFATCTSPLSRNFGLGTRLAQGMPLEQAQQSLGQTTEGVKTLRAILDESRRRDLSLPLAESLAAFLFEALPFEQMMRRLTVRA